MVVPPLDTKENPNKLTASGGRERYSVKPVSITNSIVKSGLFGVFVISH